MKRRATILAVLLAGIPAVLADEPARAPARRSVRGASVEEPGGSGWTVVQASETRVSFRRADGAAVESAMLSALETPAFDDEKKFLWYAEKRKESELARDQMLSFHFNHTKFKDVPCVRYDGIFRELAAKQEDAARKRPLGYVCRHPALPGTAVEVVFSRTADEKSWPASTMAVGDAFLRSVEFTRGPAAK